MEKVERRLDIAEGVYLVYQQEQNMSLSAIQRELKLVTQISDLIGKSLRYKPKDPNAPKNKNKYSYPKKGVGGKDFEKEV